MTDPYVDLYEIQTKINTKIETVVDELFKLVFTNQELINILLNILKTRITYDVGSSCPASHCSSGACSLCEWFSNHSKEYECVKRVLSMKSKLVDESIEKFNKKYDSILKIGTTSGSILFYCCIDFHTMAYFYIRLNACKIKNDKIVPVIVDGHPIITKMEKEDSCKMVSFKLISEPKMIPYYNIKMRCTDYNSIIVKYKSLLKNEETGDDISETSFEP